MTGNCWKDTSSKELKASIEDKKRIHDLKKSVNRFWGYFVLFYGWKKGTWGWENVSDVKYSPYFVQALHETTLVLTQGCFMKNIFILKNT